jgi:hypothetical protein
LITSAVSSVFVEKPLPRASMADICRKNKENSPLGGGEVTLYAGIDGQSPALQVICAAVCWARKKGIRVGVPLV